MSIVAPGRAAQGAPSGEARAGGARAGDSRTGAAPRARARRAAWGLAGASVLAEVGYPLVHGHVLDVLTAATVLLAASAGAVHAGATRGPAWAARMVALFTLTGFAVEALGVHTGIPFGRYRYTATLGPELAGVPVVVAGAWAMLGYPALLVGRRIGSTRAGRVLAGGLALAAWDLFLDPQMVAAGHWHWQASGWPRLGGVPLSNDLGWLAVSLLLMAAAEALCRPGRDAAAGRDAGGCREALPVAFYAWTWASSLLADLVFFGLPLAALTGGVAMGAVLARATRRR